MKIIRWLNGDFIRVEGTTTNGGEWTVRISRWVLVGIGIGVAWLVFSAQ